MNLVRIALRPSHGLIGLMLAAHLLALVVACSLLHPVWVSAGVALLILLNLVHTCWRILHPDIVELSVDDKNGLAVQRAGGTWFPATVSGDSLVTSFMSIINIKIAGERFGKNVLLLPDMLDEEQYRWLRVWLKWKPDN